MSLQLNRTMGLILTVILLAACSKKQETIPDSTSKIYTNYNDRSLVYDQSVSIDIDKDGTNDFLATTTLVAAGGRSYLQFRVVAHNGNKLLFKDDDPAIYGPGEKMPAEDRPPYVWIDHQSAVLIEKVFIPNNDETYWQGVWKAQYKKSLAVQLIKDNKHYYGWIRFSCGTEDKEAIILHDAMICNTPERILPSI